MRAIVDLDHTSFAVRDELAWASRLRRELGAVPIAGESLPDFRYLLLYVGTAAEGARLELLGSNQDGFLSRFLSRQGEGPHHLTFTVDDLAAVVSRVRALGLTVTGESYGHASWREAFIAPDALHATVIQLAQTDLPYPAPAELLATRVRDHRAFPSTQGATDPTWWTPVWDAEPESSARLGATHLGSSDLFTSRRLFEDVLAAEVEDVDGALRFRWKSGAVLVHPSSQPGITGMSLDGGPAGGVRIGDALLAPDPHRKEGYR